MTNTFLRRLSLPAALAVLTVAASAFSTGTAHAAEPGGPCDPRVSRTGLYEVSTAVVEPVLTHRKGITIAPGTTGSVETTVTEVENVSTTFNASTEINAEAGAFFAKVSIKVGFSVQTSKSTTSTWSQKVTYNVNRPGDYMVFKGTHRIQGKADEYVCVNRPWSDPGDGYWAYAFGSHPTYSTFDAEMEGIVSCDTPVNPGTIQELARNLLVCH
ncbi:hypothetical protein DR950_00705 [Kitasatospora xanthocidica]|uniref:Uncharacterized protein n=1 Tax=Kitasatospora xanthocidica TaxID=83382 RepID=A0A372ZKZ4_9ACTN|nr:hypothetical protein [Kitasatospora xanthocidica]RGD56506.1 hypothetical protein DR950_00705 [Kitasatospora xanthocidica]